MNNEISFRADEPLSRGPPLGEARGPRALEGPQRDEARIVGALYGNAL